MSREYTNKLLEMMEEGMLPAKKIVMMAVKYMSESDISDMMHANELFYEPCSQCGTLLENPDCQESLLCDCCMYKRTD